MTDQIDPVSVTPASPTAGAIGGSGVSMTRKMFLTRAALGTVAAAAISLAGSGTAEAGAQPHMREVLKLLDRSSRELDVISASWSAPAPPDVLAVTAELQAIVADCAHMTAVAQRLLATLAPR